MQKQLNHTSSGNCGSCYAVSGAYVLQRRFEILLKKLFPRLEAKEIFASPLSPQTILSCSVRRFACCMLIAISLHFVYSSFLLFLFLFLLLPLFLLFLFFLRLFLFLFLFLLFSLFLFFFVVSSFSFSFLPLFFCVLLLLLAILL